MDMNNPPSDHETLLLCTNLQLRDMQTTPPLLESTSGDDWIATEETTARRLQRYADCEWSSNDSDWTSDDTNRHFTGSSDTSGQGGRSSN